LKTAPPLPPPAETSDGEGSSDEADGEGGEGEVDEEVGGEVDGAGEVDAGNDSDGEDSLTAPTLQLGEQSDDDDRVKTPPLNVHGHLPDSQVRPDGWLGGFYHTWATYYDKDDIDRKNAGIPTSKSDDIEINAAICKQVLLQDVKDGLEKLKLHGHSMFEDYMAHCKDSLDTYGDTIASTLASEQHFNTWLQIIRLRKRPSMRCLLMPWLPRALKALCRP